MNVNLEHYKVFREVAKKLSFSAAANSLYITQPAVSQTINTLEKSLNTSLFIRGSKGVSLTLEGKLLFNYVESALNLLQTGENKIAEILKLNAGEVKIAAADTISKQYLLPFLEEFNKLYPNIKIKVVNRTTQLSMQLLYSGIVDLAFVNLPVENTVGVKVHKCLKVHDIFVASNKYEQLKYSKISPKELVDYPLILLEDLSISRKYVDEYFISHSINMEPEIELGSHDLLLEFSKIGLGISCVVKEFSQKYLTSNELFEVKLSPPIKSRHIGMLSLENVPMSIAAKEFVKLVYPK